ncbi:MAG: uroporphyrinogen decarboxylase family protein [Phycisphaerae bacterium]
MIRRELVKAAIQHDKTECPPYFMEVCPEAWDKIKIVVGEMTQEEFIDNDVMDVPIPWWNWQDLGPEWSALDPPASSRPKVTGLGSYQELIDFIKVSKNKCDKYLLARIYGSHFEKAYFSRGIENFLADMAGEPKFAHKLLNLIIEKNIVMLENFLAMPEIDGVLLGSDWGSQRDLLMSYDTWQNMIRPGEEKEYDLIHSYGKDVWVHSCGNVEKIIPSLIQMGVEVLNPIQPEAMDIYKLKKLYGDKLTFWGGISTQRTLPYGSPEDVKKEARDVRDVMSQHGGYIFSAAQSIQSDVPIDNFLALLEIAREKS